MPGSNSPCSVWLIGDLLPPRSQRGPNALGHGLAVRELASGPAGFPGPGKPASPCWSAPLGSWYLGRRG